MNITVLLDLVSIMYTHCISSHISDAKFRDFEKMKGILARAWTLLNLTLCDFIFSQIGQKSAEFLESTADYDAQSALMLHSKQRDLNKPSAEEKEKTKKNRMLAAL